MPIRVSAVRSAWASLSMAQGPASSASGCPPPIRTEPTGTTRVPTPGAPARRSAADEVVLEPGLADPIELVARGLLTDLRVLPSELGATPLRRPLVLLGQLLDHALYAEPLRRGGAALADLVDPRRLGSHEPDAGVADAVEARRLHGTGQRETLVHHGLDSLAAAGGAREHEEDLVAVAGGGEALRLVAGVLVRTRGDLLLVSHEHLHVRTGRAVVLVGALANRLAEGQGLRDVVVRHVGRSMSHTVDAVPFLVDLAERVTVAQGRDPLA